VSNSQVYPHNDNCSTQPPTRSGTGKVVAYALQGTA